MLSRTISFLFLCIVSSAGAAEWQIERLTWAGIKIVRGETTVLIDAVGTDLWNGSAPEGLVPVDSTTPRTYALVTHMHNDHFSVETLERALGARGYVICHEADAAYVASRGLRVIPAELYQPVFRGGFAFTAVPAEDGLGDNQVSWIVSDGTHRVLHGGDTLWHGQWGNIGRQYGPFDVAFLPINGARVGSARIVTPAVQTPLQAVDAAELLGASVVVPIHYGLHDPPNYVEVAKPLETLQALGKERGVTIRHLTPGERWVLSN